MENFAPLRRLSQARSSSPRNVGNVEKKSVTLTKNKESALVHSLSPSDGRNVAMSALVVAFKVAKGRPVAIGTELSSEKSAVAAVEFVPSSARRPESYLSAELNQAELRLINRVFTWNNFISSWNGVLCSCVWFIDAPLLVPGGEKHS